MANIQGQKKWSDVRLLETHEFARGGLTGNMNEQAQALLNRTEVLRNATGIIDESNDTQQEINNKTTRFYQNIADVIASKTKLKNNEIIIISEFHAGTSRGGGYFKYETGRLKNSHNGGTIIDLDQPFPADWNNKTQITAWLTPSSQGNGCLVRMTTGRNLFTASNFGAIQNEDSTLQIQKAVDSAQLASDSAWLEAGDSFKTTGLDLGSSYKKLQSNCINIEFALPILTIVGSPILFNSSGKSVGVFLGEASSDADVKRSQVLKGIRIVEGSSAIEDEGKRYYGVYGKGVPHHDVANLVTDGFDVGCLLTYCWLTNTDNLSFRDFRVSGLATIDNDVPGTSASNNGWNVGKIHASSSKNPPQNFDFGSTNSIFIASLTSEGTKSSHFKITSRTRVIVVGALHCEGAANFIAVDVDTNNPTLPFANISILSGTYFNAGGSGKQFVKRIGATANIGLANLSLGALVIQKSSAAEAAFFDLSSVAVFNTQAVFENYLADATINAYTWFNIGGLINRTFKRGQFGHNGLLSSSLNKGIYTGLLKTELQTKSAAGSAMTTAQNIVAVKLGTAQRFDVEVVVEYTSGAFGSRYFYAKFLLMLTVNNTLIVKAISDNDIYAKDTVFALNVVNGCITATNPANIGTFYFDIVKKENVTG